ncbi:MAG: prepilin-type N-terminal cleavage/methylation domain-containing protein [Fuerstiella sp.]
MRYTQQQHLADEDVDMTNARHGVTLVEVLMSLMIMSIGVSSVAVLFPISMLRALQATQLTNAAITKYNVETLLDVRPNLIFDPDNDGNLVEHFRRRNDRNYVIDPVGFYTHFADGNSAAATTFGNNGTGPAGNITRWGGGLTATDGGNPGTSPAHARAIRMIALNLANQGDGWETQVDTQAGNVTVAGLVQLLTDNDLTQVPTSALLLPKDGNGGYLVEDPEFYRIVLFSQSGKFSQAFPLLSLDTSTKVAYYTEDLNGSGGIIPDPGEDFNMNGTLDKRSLPREFRVDLDGDGLLEPGEEVASRVLLQSRKVSDFSWLLNVRRRSDGIARSIDVVVRFNDGVDVTDERLFQATFLAGTRTVGVRKADGGATEPNIRKGKFIFDANNGVWYRIQDVQEPPLVNPPATPWGNYDYLVTLETSIRASEGAGADGFDDGSLNGSKTNGFGGAMFPAGIVDVYPMGSRTIPTELLNLGF